MNQNKIYAVVTTTIAMILTAVIITSVQSWVSVQKAFGELNTTYTAILNHVCELPLDISQARTELFRYINNYEPSPSRIQRHVQQARSNLAWITRQQLPQNSKELAEGLLKKTDAFENNLSLLKSYANKGNSIQVLLTANRLTGLGTTISSLSYTLKETIQKHILHKNELSQQKILNNHALFSVISIVFIMLLLCGVLFYNRILQGQVQKRTIELQARLQDLLESEKALKISEEKWRSLTENSPDTIILSDLNFDIRYINRAICKQMPEEIIGKSILDFVPPDQHSGFTDTVGRVMQNHKPGRIEIRYDIVGGASQYFDVRMDPVLDKGGAIEGLISSSTNITNRKNAEKTLRHSEEKYRTMIEHSNDMIWILNKSGQFTFFNERTEWVTGLKLSDWIGKSFAPLLLEEDLFMINDVFQKTINGRTVQYELRLKQHEGKILTVSVNTAPILKNGEITGIVSFGRDITEQRKLEIRMQQSQKLESIGTLAGGIAHDFNNILSPIMGYAEMLLEDIPKDSPFRKKLSGIHSGALRARDLVKQILAFSRQEKSDLKLMRIQPVIKEALHLIRSTIPTTIDIKQDIHPDCDPVKSDPTQIHQIVMNLATNAYHAMEENGGVLNVGLKPVEFGKYDVITPDMTPGLYACLSVSDTGIGMDKTLQDKIFNPFFTTKKKGKGTGMGLSVVHGIVLSMNGVVQVYSEPGIGTQFKVYFPVETALIQGKHFKPTQEKLLTGTEHILLVDDEENIITMEEQMLERLGYQTTSCTGSIEALDTFRSDADRFDLVITDMAMPKMSGDRLAAELIKIRSDIPIVLCTGFSEILSEEKAASLGIKGFLLKPITMADLAQKIRQVLG